MAWQGTDKQTREDFRDLLGKNKKYAIKDDVQMLRFGQIRRVLLQLQLTTLTNTSTMQMCPSPWLQVALTQMLFNNL